MNKNITELFCFVDDYCKIIDKNFANRLLSNGKKPTNANYGWLCCIARRLYKVKKREKI